MNNQTKSYFTPIRPNVVPTAQPKLNVELADRLIAKAEQNRAQAPPETKPVRPKQTKAANGQTVCLTPDTGSVTVHLLCEIIDTPEKVNPVWGHLRLEDSALFIGATLNRAYEPTKRAVDNSDWPLIRWLVSIAITERLLVFHRDTRRVQEAAQRYLWTLVETNNASRWDSLGVAYRLSCAHITSQITALKPGRVHRFTSFQAPYGQTPEKG